MDFQTLRGRLIEHVNDRVRNGELTERRLARMIGISQPHMHNVLKGARILSPQNADRILRNLEISLLDLLVPDEIRVHALGHDYSLGGHSGLTEARVHSRPFSVRL